MLAETITPTEELLAVWQRVLRGDHAAFQKIHRRYQPKLMAYLLPRCHGLICADDVSQEVWTRVWEKKELWHPEKGRLFAWLGTIAHNIWVDLIRKLGPEEPLSGTDDPAAPPPRHNPALEALRECLDELGGDFVQVLRMQIIDGLSTTEIAGQFQIAETTVYTRAHRGIPEVKRCVERKLP